MNEKKWEDFMYKTFGSIMQAGIDYDKARSNSSRSTVAPNYDRRNSDELGDNHKFVANLTGTTSAKDRDRILSLRSGRYYELEIVHPRTSASFDAYRMRGLKNVNGVLRPVTKVRLFVDRIEKDRNEVRFVCTGMDSFGKRMNGTYTYYLTSDLLNRRDEFILSFKEA